MNDEDEVMKHFIEEVKRDGRQEVLAIAPAGIYAGIRYMGMVDWRHGVNYYRWEQMRDA